MDQTGNFLENLFPETLTLVPTMRPFPQSQDDSWSIRDAVYSDYDLFLCFGGSAVFSIDDREYRLSAGRAFLAPPGRRINARKEPGPNFEALAQHFTLKLPGGADFFDQFLYEPCVDIEGISAEDAKRYEALTRHPGGRLVAHGLLLSMIGTFARCAWRADAPAGDPRYGFVDRIARDLEGGLGESGTVDRVLSSSPYSLDYTARLFRNRMGVTPSRYLTLCRVRAAKELLLRGASVKEAAWAAGYADELYFSRVFSKNEGLSPRDFQISRGVRRTG